MQSINVCFSTTSGIFSRIIRWFTRATVSHALITFRDEYLERVFVMEATGRGFMLQPWSKWRQHNQLVARFEVIASDEDQIEALRLVAGQLGAQYDYIGILAFALRRIWGRMKNPLASPSRMFCSEVVSRYLKELSFREFEDPESWTPGDILKLAQTDARFEIQE